MQRRSIRIMEFLFSAVMSSSRCYNNNMLYSSTYIVYIIGPYKCRHRRIIILYIRWISFSYITLLYYYIVKTHITCASCNSQLRPRAYSKKNKISRSFITNKRKYFSDKIY